MNLTINNLTINFEVYGSGEKIIFLHGWGASLQIWEGLKPYLSALPYQLIFLDLPGFGQSSLPPFPFSSENFAEVLNGFITELEIKSPILLGHSIGGKIALTYTLTYDNVKKLILIDSAGIRRRSLLTSAKILAAKSVHSFPSVIKPLASFFQSDDYRTAGPMRSTMAKVVEEDIKRELRSVKTPTLIIWGEEDPETPIRDGVIMKQSIKNSSLKIIPQCGHFPFLQQPAIVAKLIAEFLTTDNSSPILSSRARHGG